MMTDKSPQKVWIVSLVEPIFYGRLYRRLIDAHPERFAGVVMLPARFNSSISATLREAWARLRFWGVAGFSHMVWHMLKARVTGAGDVQAAAHRHDIPVYTVATMKEVLEILGKNGAELALSSVDRKLSGKTLKSLSAGWVNTHCSLLPAYGGVDAPFWALLNEEPTLGVTLHYMDEEFDTGPIISQSTYTNQGKAYFPTVFDLFEQAYQQHLEFLKDLEPGLESATPQKGEGGSYYGPPQLSDSRDFRKKGGRFI